MASPQLEDGYTRIANQILEAFSRHPFTSHQMRVLLFIVRETYGFGVKTRQLALDYIADAIGMDRAEVSRARAQLVKIGVLWKSQQGNEQHIGLVKDYSRWDFHNVVKSPTKTLGKPQQSTLGKPHPVVTKKEQQRKKERTPQAPLPDPPTWLDSKNWTAWIEIRKAMKKPLTAHAATLCLRKLERWKGEGQDPNQILEASVIGGWQGIFPLRSNGNGTRRSKETRTERELRESAAVLAAGARARDFDPHRADGPEDDVPF